MPYSQDGARVVIAESDPGRRATLTQIVRRFCAKSRICETDTGTELAEMLLAEKPTLAFVGLHLAGMSGPEAVATARKRGGSAQSLVLITARVIPQWQDLAQSLGAYEVLKTPLDPKHIDSLMHADARRRQPTHVLLASSSEHGRNAIGRVLALSGFNLVVDETDDGRHALKLLGLASYDLAFIDSKLGGLDGFELACQAQALGLSTRITLMTAGDPEPLAQAARYFGVDSILRMPFYPRDIDLALHHALTLRRPYLLNAITAPPAPTALTRITDLAPTRRTA